MEMENRRALLHTQKDSARATVDCLFSNKVNNKTINIGNNKSKISIMNLCKMISKLMNKKY